MIMIMIMIIIIIINLVSDGRLQFWHQIGGEVQQRMKR